MLLTVQSIAAKDFPTKDYIDRHMEAYTNPNLTVWGGRKDRGVR